MADPSKASPPLLPPERGRHCLAIEIDGERVPVWWQVGRSLQPCAAVTAMIHGDEYEGLVAAQAIWKWAQAIELEGSLLVLPVCNPAAAKAAMRHTPDERDGLNLARTFPGAAEGSYTQRLADAIWGLLQPAQTLIDLHSGGMGYHYARLAGFYREADAGLSACHPEALLWPVPSTPGVLSYEFSRVAAKVALGWECGGEGRLDVGGADAYVTGIRRVLARVGVIAKRPGDTERTEPAPRLGETHRQAASSAGWFFPTTQTGARVQRGEPLGRFTTPDLEITTITSEHTGIVIALRTLPRVETGDDLTLVAEPANA